MTEYQPNRVIGLESDNIYQVRKGMVTWFFGVKKGSYIAKYQDESGYYFEGSNYSACMGTQGKTGECTSRLMGGIWQSKTDPTDFRMYSIDGSSEEESSSVQGYALTLGKYVIETKSEEFSKKVGGSF
ncbi:hypothetical protein CWC29_007210 [Pseudoalteromonas sp. S4498]|uniref:Uncharacterized protein n=1 Tax=Pseudoalteromonas galatheae TaxID=579562 RepID=A0A8T6YP49_9GAMM|nr:MULTISPECIES: hypothetical protein [Pseudoalteromonas]MCG9759205.1 hypothetical protein [Pseudoalteromonas sp. Isolate6]NKC18632.1 hypothetical protein [Pseudoalteromonas galatheae]